MWRKIQELIRWGGRKLGIIKNLNSIKDHKNLSIDDTCYNRVNVNKSLYMGHFHPWHDLRYNVNGRQIERKQMTMGMPKVISKKLARLCFNEGVKISVSDGKAEQWEYIKDVFEGNKFIREFQRYLEYMFAMGGVAVEIYMDGEQPKIAYATADAFFPVECDSESIDEAVIANTFIKNEWHYTLLKWHEWENGIYRINNELYRSKAGDTLGEKIRLSEMFPDMEATTSLAIDNGLFVYLKPNEANNIDITSPLGVSVFENAKDTIRMLDVMYDFWYNEFRLGKRRVAVPDYMINSGTNINGEPYLYFDESEELFVALNSAEMDEFEIKDLTTNIRDDQVIHSIQSLLDILSMQVGLSAGTFTFTRQGVKTATQVVSENSETYQTRSSHLSVIEDGLRDLIVKIWDVCAVVNELGLAPIERDDISIDFNDGIFIDQASKAKYYIDLYKAGAISQLTMIKNINDLSDEEAEEELAEIMADKQRTIITQEQAINQAEMSIER